MSKYNRKPTQFLIFLILVIIPQTFASQCGCKLLRGCYKNMLNALLDRDEVPCIEDAAIGYSGVTVFLKALKHFCFEVFDVLSEHMSFEGRALYEVHLASNDNSSAQTDVKPIIMIEAGQEGGSLSVMLALYIIEQLVACEEYDQMLKNVRWIILPSTNPDGQEFSRYSSVPWKKNLKPHADDASVGVDITRNFDVQWATCPRADWGFSQNYPGPSAASENETRFIAEVVDKHKKDIKMYLSIKRDGHSINFPYAHKSASVTNVDLLTQIAINVTTRVNQRTGGIHTFTNGSIFDAKNIAHCGHSVDFIYDLGITESFEMRVFLESDKRIISKFQPLPRGYESTLRNGYFSGVRELYSSLLNTHGNQRRSD